MAEYIEDTESEVQDQPQQYEGDEIDALVLAKQRMAERDAEYASQHSKPVEGRLNKPSKPAAKPVAKPAAKPAAKSEESFAYAEDAPLVEAEEIAAEEAPAKRNPEMTAPIVKEAADKVRSAFSRAFNSKTTDVGYKDANRGLRSLKGESELPKTQAQKERDEFVTAFKKK